MKIFSFKDPIVDEQFRLITDLLYNKREVYQGQLAKPTFPWWLGKTLTGCAADGANGQNLVDWEGTNQTRTSPEVITVNTDTEEYVAWAGSAAIGGRAGYTIGSLHGDMLPNGNSTIDQISYCPYVFLRIKLSSITDLRFHWIAFGNQDNTNNDNPWGAGDTVNGGVAFNFLPASSPNWFIVAKVYNTAALTVNFNTGVPVAADTFYNLEVAVRGQGANRITTFWIDGVLVHTITGDTSYSVQQGGGAISSASHNPTLYPTVAASKRMGISYSLWGRNAQPRLAVPNGFSEWIADDTF